MERSAEPYCLLHQSGRTLRVTGRVETTSRLADMARPRRAGAPMTISMVPYAQLRERGYRVHDGGEPIITLVASEVKAIALDELGAGDGAAIAMDQPVAFGISDEEFTARVADIIRNEIQNGEGSNFLFSRKSRVRLRGFGPAAAATLFQRLARNEFGAYLTFCFFDGQRTFIGSSPERHMTYTDGVVQMNPICGTLPKAALRGRADLCDFLSDPKEVNELFQVVDEELKMMSKICAGGGEIHGPYLKEMSALVHTEYLLRGRSTLDPIDALRTSMFAATMIGSPLENAARVIHKYETESRRYYSSAIVLLTPDAAGGEALDSAITIRTMEVEADGTCHLQTGASIVRDSVPEKECAEIKAKAAGLLRAITSGATSTPDLDRYRDARVDALLESRNKYLSRFWLQKQSDRPTDPRLAGKSILIVDNEDEFTFMLRHILERLGMRATVKNYDDPDLDLAAADLVLIGPGPGDPANLADPKMAAVHALTDGMLRAGRPFLAVCLGHQILCLRLGLQTVKVDPPLQGVQKTIELFGRTEACGFYNTFFAVKSPALGADVEAATEDDGRINALRAPRFMSFQFHVESVLTTNGVQLLQDAIHWLVR